MKLLVGLGNPGKKYERTRHNVGSWLLSLWLKEKNENFPEVLVLFPKTFMNLSGTEVKKVFLRRKLSLKNLLVIHDDMDIPLGKMKISFASRSAGHNGVQSIIDAIGTKDFYRLRIGVNPLDEKGQTLRRNDPSKFVLQKFSKEEFAVIQSISKGFFKEIEKFILQNEC